MKVHIFYFKPYFESTIEVRKVATITIPQHKQTKTREEKIIAKEIDLLQLPGFNTGTHVILWNENDTARL